MKNEKLKNAVDEVLQEHHVGVFGHYLLSGSDVAKLVMLVLRVLGTAAQDNCQTCFSELIQDIEGSNG